MKTLAAALVLLAAVMPALAQEDTPAAPTPEPRIAKMGTGAITGVYFPVGIALCRLVNQHRRDTGLRCAALPTEGSVANIAGLRDGSLALALVQSDTQSDALTGTGPFAGTGSFPELAAVLSLHREPLTLVARADAGIAGLADLAGKRVWRGAEGSGTRVLVEDLGAALGWTDTTVAPVPDDISLDRVSSALCEGRIDAFFYAVGQPAPVIQSATTSCDARLVPITGAAVDALVAGDPSLVATTIPGGLYLANPQPTPTYGVNATLVTRADQPEATIHEIVAAIFGDFDTLRSLDPVLVGLDARAMATEGLTAPLHPGAARFYREQGWIE